MGNRESYKALTTKTLIAFGRMPWMGNQLSFFYELDTLKTFEMGVLGPYESSMCLSGCQDDTVGQRKPNLISYYGCLESNPRTQRHHLPLVHDSDGLECCILTPLLKDAFEHFKDTDGWDNQIVDVFYTGSIKIGI